MKTEQELLAELHALRTRVAELERAEEEHKQQFRDEQEANQRMDEFLSIVSHELRTPLTSMNGNIQLAKRRLQVLMFKRNISQDVSNDEAIDDFEVIYELLSRTERQVKIQNRLVNDLLDVSRIQANRLELHLQVVDLAQLVRETTENMRVMVPERTIALTMAAMPVSTEILVAVDTDRMNQVLTNYILNALKYSAPDRPVHICLETIGTMARVCVRDEGPGLPPQEREQVWQRFYQVPGVRTQSGSGGGLGLGLYICRTIIERHEGRVGLDSVVGKGSTFWFTVPMV